jgi:carboxyl-terminal processing protease
MKKIAVALGFIACAAVLTLSTGLQAVAKDRYMDLQLFAKVLNLIQQYYVEEVDTKKLIYGGVKGMLRELDPHTNFLPPDIYKEFETETSGEFGGLGVEITVSKGVLTIISPIEDAPAWVAGIKAGDRIVTINGESTKGWTLVEAAQKMKGTKGSKITLGIFRDGFEKPKDFAVTRGVVKIKSVKYTDLEDGYAYLRLTSFIDNSARDMKAALETHVKKNKSTKGLVIDLRRNPGGLLDQAVQISDMFLPKGTIVSTVGRNKKEQELVQAKADGTQPNYPLIILIDEFSASASEIVAGALQDNKRALIMGQRSFGKGSVQSVVKLGDGSGLKLTVARYYTPNGRSIQAEGIRPDVTIDNLNQEVLEKALIKQEVRRERDMKNHLVGDEEAEENAKATDEEKTLFPFFFAQEAKGKVETPKAKLLKGDFQVLQAYNYLRAWDVMKSFDENKTGLRVPAAVE